MELLRFKLAEEHLILASGHHAWLDRATAEVEQVVEMLELADSEREEAVAALGEELWLGTTPTLAQLVTVAPEPWSEILAGHRQSMVEHFEEIEKISAANREILAQRMASTADALAYSACSLPSPTERRVRWPAESVRACSWSTPAL